jgi:hypothetical protein
MTKPILLDAIENLEVPLKGCENEVGTLRTLVSGIKRLYAPIKTKEVHFEQATGGKMIVSSFGATNDEERELNDIIACYFHWFGISICNYVRLTGFIRGMNLGHFSRKDLRDSKNFKTVRDSTNAYVDSVVEIEPVRVWRNKVFAHFAITDPLKDDNIATLDMSVIHPITFEGKYFVGGMTMFLRNEDGSATSELPRWSLTEVFEALTPRYWPNLEFTPPEMKNEQSPEWTVYNYERDMVLALCNHLPTPENNKPLSWELGNAAIEALVLHTRILTDILVSKGREPDDINLTKLLPGFNSVNIDALKSAYGTRNAKDSPCWQFNKLMAHATSHRKDSHEYLPALKITLPIIGKLLDEIEAARKTS